MGALDDLASYLVLGQAQKQAIAQDDPYASGSQLGSSLLQQTLADTVQRPNDGSLKDRVATAAITGLFGGLLGGLSNNYQGRAADAYTNTLLQAAGGGEVEKPRVLGSSIFADAKQRGSILNLQAAVDQAKLKQQADAAQTLQRVKSQDDLNNGLLLEIAKNPYKADKILSALGAATAKTTAQPIGIPTTAAPSVDPYEAALQKYGGDEELARKTVERDMEAPDRLRKEEDAARTEIDKLPAVSQFKAVTTTLGRLGQLKDLDTSTSDIPFIYAFVQGLDGSVVKEGEYATIQGTNPILNRFKGLFESQLNGGSGLTVDVKRQIVNELQGTQAALYDVAKEQAKPRLATATERGVTNTRNALGFDPEMKLERPMEETPANVAALKQLAAQFPHTPEGRAAFKAEAAKLGL